MPSADTPPILLLWDESHIWGLLVLEALAQWGQPVRLARGRDLAEHGVPAGVAILIAPGGFASRKAAALGPQGAAAVRRFVAAGGLYLGFCGGAGLALSGDGGLGLCPWERQPFTDRMHHFVSGHMRVRLPGHPLTPPALGETALLPVWWPGQFAPQADSPVQILAEYEAPGEDVWMADLRLSDLAGLPAETLADWQSLYGVSLSADFLKGRPCVIRGELGLGSYVLSYAHLETPASPAANQWLAHILGRAGATLPGDPATLALAPRALTGLPAAWQAPVLLQARQEVEALIKLGLDHLLLFWRNSWLLGWRRGIPGASLGNLQAMLAKACSLPPRPQALSLLGERGPEFSRELSLFVQGARSYLLAERLSMTVARDTPAVIPARALKDQRATLFGPPPGCGGLYGRLMAFLDELIYLQLTDNASS